MKYVSAQYVESPIPGGQSNIKAIGDDGNEYWIPSIDTDVPPWPEFIAEGGTVEEAEPVAPPVQPEE
jgi:hypothetical protein